MKRANLRIFAMAAVIAGVFSAGAYEVTNATKIVIPDGDGSGVNAALREAATELCADIEEATGLKLKVLEESKAGDTKGAILIGEKFAAKAGLLPADLRFFDNVIAEKGGRLYLSGRDKPCRNSKTKLSWMKCVLASVKAVTDFEYRFMGVKRILPGKIGTEIPKQKRISVPDGFRRVERPIMESGMGRCYGMMYSIANNIFGFGTYQTYGGHTYHHAIPDDRYFKSNPEYFAMKNGKRVLGSGKGYSAICISNPDVKRLIVSFILSEFDAGADVVELGQQDSGEFCECKNCQAYGGADAKTIGEKHWIFHRLIAEELYRLRPDKTVQIVSYRQTDCTPVTFKEFPPNVMVELTTYSDDVFDAWSEYVVPRGFSVYVYMWGDYQPPGLTCKASTSVFSRLARRFIKRNVRSIYRSGYGELFGCEGPASYVFNMLLADPDKDENVLLEEYVTAAYGPAADHMRKFHKAFDERVAAWAACFNSNRKWPWPRDRQSANTICAIYTPTMLDLCETSLTAAENTPGLSQKTRKRLELVRKEFAYTRLTAEVCMLFNAYKVSPSLPLFDDIAVRVKKRNLLIDSFFNGAKHPKRIEGWPDFRPFGMDCTKDRLMHNGRLFAPLHEPFNWNFNKMRKMLANGVDEKKTAKACTDRSKAKWNKVGGIMLGKCDFGTRFRCYYDDRNFYVEVDAELPDSLEFQAKGHDSAECFKQECLEIFIDPFFRKTHNFHFAWNPVRGSFYDEAFGFAADPLDPEADKYKVDWSGKWEYSTKRENGRWSSIVSIPFSTLGVSKPLSGAKWYFNLGRETPKKDSKENLQLQLWSPSMGGRGMRDLECMGVVEFQ